MNALVKPRFILPTDQRVDVPGKGLAHRVLCNNLLLRSLMKLSASEPSSGLHEKLKRTYGLPKWPKCCFVFRVIHASH